jgi:hypothetical protein
MADHASETKAAATTETTSLTEAGRQKSDDDAGLRSVRSIRWLLLAGALVTAVSLFRLVESQWASIPVAAQYLVVVFGALALYGTGELAHRRLGLPLAGSALMLLFTALVPVLSWGAVYLDLLARPFGWLAFAIGTAALLGAAHRPLRIMLGYRGVLYPAVFALFILAQPVLPLVADRIPNHTAAIYLAAALLLGLLLQIGSRHINRFFFHRDRQDGVERPIRWMPFVVLGVLYLGAMVLLDPRSELMALPLAVIGMVLADTGEEYYRALIRARGETPEKWPRRSVAMLAIGIAAMVVALPLSFADPSLRCTALVALCAAAFFGRWSLRSPGLPSHLAALGSVWAAYHFIPALVPDLAKELWARLLAALDLSHGSPLALSIADLGFLLILVAWSGLLRKTPVTDRLRAIHAGIAVIYLWWLSVLAVIDPADPSLFLTVLGVVGLVGLVVSRRPEFIVGIYGTLSALILVLARQLLGEPQLLTAANLLVLGAATLMMSLAVLGIKRPPTRLLGIDAATTRRFLMLPAAAVAVLIAIHGLAIDLLRNDLGGLELILAGAVFLVAGVGLGHRFLPALGGLATTIGVHVLVFQLTHTVAPAVVLTTQLLAVGSLWGVVAVACGRGPIASLLRPTAFILALLHCLLGLWWLLLGIANWDLTVEPMILVILGVLAADVGLTTRSRANVITGGFLIALFAQLQFLAIAGIDDWTVAIPASFSATALGLVVLVLLGRGALRTRLQRRYALENGEFRPLVVGSAHSLTDFWTAVSVVVCLFFCGPAALILAASMLVVVALVRIGPDDQREIRDALSLRLLLIFLFQLVVILAGGGSTVMPLELVINGLDLLPLTAAAVLGWRLLVHLMGRQQGMTEWSLTVELGLGVFLIVAALAPPELSILAHAVIVAVAAALVVLRVASGASEPRALHSWMAQIWVGLAILHGFTAGWLHLDGAAAPWVLLGVAITEHGLATGLARTRLGPVFGPTCRLIGLGLPLVAWIVAMMRTVGHGGSAVWLAALPAFAASLFYAVVAVREDRSTGASLAAAITLGWTLLAVFVRGELGFEFYFLAPGLSLMALAALLRPRAGRTWSSYLATAGAAFLYATPIIALADQVSWMWLAVLLVMTVATGSACIALRSRSLLVVSTAAMLTDLAFFVFKIGTTEPMLLWVFGLAFGLGLMAWAAYLEYQREGLLQQIRVFGREFKSWS